MSSPPSSTRATKIKPRAGIVRKTAAEREAFEAEEAKRQKVRGEPRGVRDVYDAARGRGGRVASTNTVTRGEDGGVFGAGSGTRSTRSRPVMDSGLAEVLSGEPPPAVETQTEKAGVEKGKEKITKTTKPKLVEDKAAQGTADKSVPVKEVQTFEVVSDSEPDVPTRDIEEIWISSEDDDDDEDEIVTSKWKGKQKSSVRTPRRGGLRPIRAPRTEVESEDARTKKQQQKTALNSTSASAKEARAIDVDETDIDRPADAVEFVKEVPSSPETRKRNLKKPAIKGKDARYNNETIEERAERLRVQEDVVKLKQLFKPTHAAHDGALDLDNSSSFIDEENKLLLFQFPPFIPQLIDPDAPPPPAPEEPDTKEENCDAAATALARTGQQPPQPPIKREPGILNTTAGTQKDGQMQHAKAVEYEDLITAPSLVPASPSSTHHQHQHKTVPSGLIGKLNVHESGKITLDWGGVDMEVRRGTDVDFLQDVVLVEGGDDEGTVEMDAVELEKEEDDKRKKATGRVYALGQIRGKCVVVPDWGRLYD